MSRIYWHTRTRTVKVHGSERAYMDGLGAHMAITALHLSGAAGGREWLRTVLVDTSYDVLQRDGWWVRGFETWMRAGRNDGGLLVAGEKIGPTELAANTLIATGSPILAFIAKVDGTCEDHAWIESEHAGWAREIIRTGRERNLLRPLQGWEDVIDLLGDVETGRVAGPVVLSYSVCEGFPNAAIADWEAPICKACGGDGKPNLQMRFTDADYDYCTSCDGDGCLHDAWYDLPEGEQWRLAEAGMRAREYTRQIAPGLVDVGFQSGASAFDLAAERWELRRARALLTKGQTA